MAKKSTNTPVKYRGNPVNQDSMKSFMDEWSLRSAEANHVETLEEANDFAIYEEEDDFFPPNLTVYEMHEAAEDNLVLLEQTQLNERLEAESNETVTGAQDSNLTPLHDQSAPGETNSPQPETQTQPLSANENSDKPRISVPHS